MTDHFKDLISTMQAAIAEAEAQRERLDTIAATIRVNALRHGATDEQVEAFLTGEADFVGWIKDQISAPKPAQAVKVGTLVWDYLDGVPDYHVWEVLTVLGRYKVQQSIENDYALLVRPNGAINQHPTIEAAKAAAQANYEDRIMAALEPQPITVQDAAKTILALFVGGAIDPFDCTDLAVEALAIKHAGNRRDGVGQLEIAEEFFVAALAAIAEGRK